LPGQSGKVSDRPVYQLSDLPALVIGNGLDEAILAVPNPLFAEIPSLLQQLKPLCIPIRAVLDWGESVKIREQLFYLGGIQMLDEANGQGHFSEAHGAGRRIGHQLDNSKRRAMHAHRHILRHTSLDEFPQFLDVLRV